MVEKISQRLVICSDYNIAFLIPVPLLTPWVRMVPTEVVVEELLIEDFDSLTWWHLKFLLKAFKSKAHKHLKELVADDLALWVVYDICPEWELLITSSIRGNKSQIAVRELRQAVVHKVIAT